MIYITLEKTNKKKKQKFHNQRFFQRGWGGGNDVTVGNNSGLHRPDNETVSQISETYFQR